MNMIMNKVHLRTLTQCQKECSPIRNLIRRISNIKLTDGEMLACTISRLREYYDGCPIMEMYIFPIGITDNTEKEINNIINMFNMIIISVHLSEYRFRIILRDPGDVILPTFFERVIKEKESNPTWKNISPEWKVKLL